MLRFLAILPVLLAGLTGARAHASAGEGRFVSIPEPRPSAELSRAVREHLALESDPLRLHLGDDAPEGSIALSLDDDAWLFDRALAERMAAAEALEFSGGTFLEWYDQLLKDRRRTRFTGAIFDAMRRGTHVIARGGAAAFFSRGTSIPRAELIAREDSRPRNPRDVGEHSPVVGLGLGPPGSLDAAALGGSMERLCRALDDTHVDTGWWVAPDAALGYDFAASRVTIIGPGHAVLLDLDGARRMRHGTYGARLSVLQAGDAWSRETRRFAWRVAPRAVGTNADGTAADERAIAAARAWYADLFPAAREGDEAVPYAAETRADASTRWTGADERPRPVALHLDWRHPLREGADADAAPGAGRDAPVRDKNGAGGEPGGRR